MHVYGGTEPPSVNIRGTNLLTDHRSLPSPPFTTAGGGGPLLPERAGVRVPSGPAGEAPQGEEGPRQEAVRTWGMFELKGRCMHALHG